MIQSSKESTPRERLMRTIVLVKRARRYWRGASLLAAVLVAASLGLSLATKRVWRSETAIVYRDAVQTGKEGESPAQRSARLGPRLKEIVLSRTRLASVVDELGLYPELTERSMLEAVDEMQKNISFRVRSTDTFVLSFTHDDPAVAQKVTARLAALMIEDYGKDNLSSAEISLDVQQRELKEADELVQNASRALAKFLSKNPSFTWGVGDSPYAPVTPATPIPLRSSPPAAPIAEDPSGLATDARKRRDAAAAALEAAELDLSAKLVRLTPAHPDAISARMKAAAARAALASAERDLELVSTNERVEPRRPARSSTKAAEKPEAASKEPDSKEGTVELETEWHKLRLDLERARDHFRKTQDKERLAQLAKDAAEREREEELVVVDPAYYPVRPDRGRGRVFFAGSFLAFFFALGYAGTRVLVDETLHDEGDIEALSGPSLLVTVPHVPVLAGAVEGDVLARFRESPSHVLGALRVLRHRLEARRATQPLVVSIVSPHEGEGKTEIALRLAMTLSEADRASVVLVEANLESPTIAARLGLRIPEEMGISAQLEAHRKGGSKPFRAVRVTDSLHVLAEPSSVAAFPELLHSSWFTEQIRALAEQFDYVILDGPAVLGSGDANVLEGASDVTIVLARAGRTRGSELLRAEKQLGERRIFGVVLNDVPETTTAKKKKVDA